MEAKCTCQYQSGLCAFCSTKLHAQIMAAPKKAVRLKVWLATKRADAAVRHQWQRELAAAERLASS